MLPFLKPKLQGSGISMQIDRKPDSDADAADDIGHDDSDSGLVSAAEDLIRAIHSKDAAGVKDALKAAFDMLESEPHSEADESDELPDNFGNR